MSQGRAPENGSEGHGPSQFYRTAKGLVSPRRAARAAADEAGAAAGAARSKFGVSAKRALRRRVPWSIGELYLALGVALARDKRFEAAADAFERARKEDETFELEVLAELANSATLAGAADLAVRANLTLALRDTSDAGRLAERSLKLVNAAIARQQGVWITYDWYPAVRPHVDERAAMWCALLAARAALHRSDDETALGLLDQAAAFDPERAPRAAEGVLGDAALPERLRGGDGETQWLLARAHAAVGRREEGLSAVAAALEAGPPDEIAALALKVELLEGIGRDGDAADALLSLGRAFDVETRHREAVGAFERAGVLNPSSAVIFWYLSDSRRLGAEQKEWPYADLAALEQARDDWERGMGIGAPGSAHAWVHLSGALLAESLGLAQDETGERLWHAALQAEQAIALMPDSVDAWALTARYHRSLMHPATTILAADHAIACDASNPRAIIEQVAAHALLRTPDREEVLAWATGKVSGFESWWHAVEAWSRLLDGEIDAARAGFDDALERDPTMTWALANRALALTLAGDEQAAAADARTVMAQTEPGGTAPGIDSRDQRALAALVLEQYEQAAELFESLVDTYWVDSGEARAGAACARALAADTDRAARWMSDLSDHAIHPAQLAFTERLLELYGRRARSSNGEVEELRGLVDAAAERLSARRHDLRAAREELDAARSGEAPGSVRWVVCTASLARTLVQDEAFGAAAELYEQLLEYEDPRTGFAPARSMLAAVLHRLGENGEAATVASAQRRLVALGEATKPQAALAIAAAHAAAGRLEPALEELQRAIAEAGDAGTTPDIRALHMRAGDLQLALHRLDDAHASYTRALEAARAHDVTGDERATLEARLGVFSATQQRLGDAAGHFRLALKVARQASGTAASANVVIGTRDDVLALASDPVWLNGVLRGLSEDPSLSSLERRRIASARFATLRRSGRTRAGEHVKPLLLEAADDLLAGGGDGAGARLLFDRAFPEMRDEILGATGVRIAGVRVRASDLLPNGEYRLLLHEVPYGGGAVADHRKFCVDAERCRALGATGRPLRHPFTGLEGMWMDQASEAIAESSGLDLLEPLAAVAWHLGGLIRVHLADFIGLSEIDYMLDEWEADAGPESAGRVTRALPNKSSRIRLLMVVRSLVRGQVPIDDLDRIITALEDIEPETPLTQAVEAVRATLRRSLSGLARGRRTIELPDSFEQAIVDQLRAGGDPARGELRERLLEHVGRPAPGEFLLAVGRGELRPAVQRMMETVLPSAAVLAPAELGRARPQIGRRMAATNSRSAA